jgi:colicin import membrane protein
MAGLAAGTGSAGAAGTAAQASGPSAGYGGRIRARIKPNITYTDTTSDNPTAEVEVRTSPDGTIISRKLTKPSGVKSWDDAVLNAIDKTEVLPKDVDGRVPTSLIISFRPKD